MKTRILVLSVAVALFAVAGSACANTVLSSTMVFKGTLTLNVKDGTYSGVLNMIDESTDTAYGDGIAGFDVYAREGASAWFGDDPGTGPVWTSETIDDHDAWPDWNVDTPDWYQYSLQLTGSTWAIRNHAGSTEEEPHSTIARGVPMSGTMDWTTMYAEETDTGAYIDGTGTPEIPGGAATQGDTAHAWDMDWSWGSEYVPLEYAGFNVAVYPVQTKSTKSIAPPEYYVVLTPAAIPEPFSFGIWAVLGLAGLTFVGRRYR